jgi:hypothetical protein
VNFFGRYEQRCLLNALPESVRDDLSALFAAQDAGNESAATIAAIKVGESLADVLREIEAEVRDAAA